MPVNLSSAIFTTFVVIFKEMLKKIILSAVSVFAIVSCTGGSGDLSQWNEEVYVPEYAGGFRILSAEGMQSVIITTSSPWQGSSGEERAVFVSRNGESAPDGFKGEVLKGNADRIVCMSSSYIAMLDALGETGKITGVSGMDPGDTTEVSRTIDIEEAYKLVSECDYWINTGRVATKAALIAELPKFSGMPCLEEGRVYNNNLRLNGRGGDDFWESGIMHPDIILEDLITIFHPGLLDSGRQLYYYRKLE